MRIDKALWGVGVVSLFILIAPLFVLAQGEGEEGAPPSFPIEAQEQGLAEEVDYSWGTVVDLTGDQLVLQEYAYENNEYIHQTYQLSPDLQVENAASLAAIGPGSEVEIGFITHDDQQRIAVTLYLEESIVSDENAVDEEDDGF